MLCLSLLVQSICHNFYKSNLDNNTNCVAPMVIRKMQGGNKVTKTDAVKRFTTYLKSHNIRHVKDFENGTVRYTMEYMAENAPEKYVESSVWFYKDVAEVRGYYNQAGADICKASEHRNSLLELLNFINARVFLNCSDWNGLYESHMLYTPRMYLTVDGFYDITITTIINYDFWEIAPIETADYMTAHCPELLDKLAIPIFNVLKGQMSSDEAIAFIKEKILLEA